jgi:hypothetical protein
MTMPPDVDSLADAALVQIISQGGVRGTGFVIDGNGTVLTCHHVVDGLSSVQLRGPGDETCDVGADSIVAAPEIDLALISVPSPMGTPLPIVSGVAIGTEYWTKGYHRLSEAIRDAFPVQGHIIGTTSVSYQGDTSGYDIDDVLVLRDDTIDAGLSGAPLFDLEAGAVVGVVSTKFRRNNQDGGFAVPIAHAAAHPALREAVARNQATVPAYGPYLNAPGAQVLCKEITDSEIDSLARFRSVDLSRHVPRAGVAAAIERFLSTGTPIFALTGPSGVGKSTEVAALAQQLQGRALLLRGNSLVHGSTGGLGEAIRTALNKVRGNRPLPDNTDEAIARALSADRGLIVLLDGLNEARLSGQELEEWIAKTISWLQGTPAQLIISCRSELWGDLVGRPLSERLNGRKPVLLALGAFTAEEYRQAAPAYGIPADSDWPILRLPLALRLSTRYQQQPTQPLGTLTSINEVIAVYVEEAVRKVAANVADRPLLVQPMLVRLIEVAALMWNRSTDAVDARSLGEIFGNISIVDAFVADGVMSYTPSGYRFVYDDVCDWLQAQKLDVDSELAAIRSGSWRRIGPIASALREVGRHGGSDALSERLAALIENPGDASSFAVRLAEATLAKVADAEPYSDILGRIAEMTVSGTGSFDFYFFSPESIGFWRSIPLPLVQRLGLLRRLCLCDNYYHWRAKDWAGWGDWAESTAAEYDYAALAYNLIRQEPATGIPALVPWLSDTTKLAGDRDGSDSLLGRGEATVADVAMGILYRLRTEQERLVWEALINASERCSTLIYQLADDDPDFLVRMIRNEPNAQSTDSLVISTADTIFVVYNRRQVEPSAEMMQALCHAVASRYSRGIDRGLVGPALKVLIKCPDGQKYAQAAVNAFQEKVPGVSEHTLAAAAAQDSGNLVMPVLAEALARGEVSRRDALGALKSSATDPKVRALGDKMVRQYLESGMGDVDYEVSRYAEDRIAAGDLSEDVLYVAQRVIDAPAGSGRYVLVYTLTNFRGPGDPVQRLALLRKFVDATADGESASLLVRRILEECPPPEAFEWLQPVLARLESSEADRILIRQAFGNEQFPDVLADWLTTGKLSAPGEYTHQFQARIESGEKPTTAAEEVRDQIIRNRNN